MKSCYSILKFVNNPLSDEAIAIGLIAISSSKIFYSTSLKKIWFAKSLNKQSSKLLDFSLRQFDKFIELEQTKDKSPFFNLDKKFTTDYLNKLSNYHNGILQFSRPCYVENEIDQSAFNKFYEKFVILFDDEDEIKAPKPESILKKNLHSKVQIPLKGKIDIDYTIHKKELPTLFFDFDFDAIGVNGSIYALKAIDINAVATSNPIQRVISEYESIIERLNDFAEKNKIPNKQAGFYLMMDKYKGEKKDLRELYDFIAKAKMPRFELLSSEEGGVFSKIIIDKKAEKLSKYIHSI